MFTESEKHIVTRQLHDIWRSKQGRDLGRVFLTEISKADGDLGKKMKEVQDIEAEVIRSLYSNQKPVQSRQG